MSVLELEFLLNVLTSIKESPEDIQDFEGDLDDAINLVKGLLTSPELKPYSS